MNIKTEGWGDSWGEVFATPVWGSEFRCPESCWSCICNPNAPTGSWEVQTGEPLEGRGPASPEYTAMKNKRHCFKWAGRQELTSKVVFSPPSPHVPMFTYPGFQTEQTLGCSSMVKNSLTTRKVGGLNPQHCTSVQNCIPRSTLD